jgi:hypothetical protein
MKSHCSLEKQPDNYESKYVIRGGGCGGGGVGTEEIQCKEEHTLIGTERQSVPRLTVFSKTCSKTGSV